MPGSRIAGIYGETEISERHRHRYEVNTAYRERLEDKGLIFAGMSPDGLLPETVELADHPWFIGVQYHPELKSRPFEPHPLVRQLHRRGEGAEPAGVGRAGVADEGRIAIKVGRNRESEAGEARLQEGWPSGLRQRC